MATLRNKRKLAAVSRETPESFRSGRTQNILDPELTQDYISQVSEEIEGRVTKKLSKEFSRTESRILGALSKLDEFFLNPQVRTCSVAVPGTSRSSNLENQGTNEDRPSDDPGPEVGSSPLRGRNRPSQTPREKVISIENFEACEIFEQIFTSGTGYGDAQLQARCGVSSEITKEFCRRRNAHELAYPELILLCSGYLMEVEAFRTSANFFYCSRTSCNY